MLYLGGGMRQIKAGEHETLYVFPDFSNTSLFYYLPNFPHVAKMEDGSPAIRLLVYRQDLEDIGATEPDAVGFLSLDVDLAWPPDVIDRAASKLRVEDRLPDKPRLMPIFFHKGSVKLMLLDAVTPEAGAEPAGDAQPTQFVTKIEGGGSPSLYGDNRAIFQASLSKKGAAALSGALDGVTPIGVVYSLTFAGLQPAFRIRAKVDWQKVYDHFSTQEHADFLFYESDVQKSIDKLREDKVIDFDVTVEGIGADAMDAEREQVMNSIRQLIFDKFFEATFKRVDPAGGGTADDIVDTLTHIHRNAMTLGIGYTYKKKEVTIEELRSLDIDWTARKATERTIYPQAHMHNLLTKAGITKEKLITTVDGGVSEWKVLPFEVMAAAAFETDGIAGITIDMEYTDSTSGATRSKSMFLNKDKTKVTYRDWMNRTSGSDFRYKYEVVFMDGSVPGPSAKLDSGPWRTHKGTVLVINPRDLYEVVELEVAAVPAFPFEQWPAVQGIVRYRTDDGSFEHYEDGVLTATTKSFKTRFRIEKGIPGTREVQLTYIGATGRRKEMPWMPMPQDQWVVEAEEGRKLAVRASVSGNRQNIATLLVDLEYEDEENGIFESGNLAFDADTIDKTLSWTINLADPQKRRYRYRMTLIPKDGGDPLQTDWISTDAPSLPVGEVYVRKLMVDMVTGELRPPVEAIEVAVAYHDAAGNVHDEQKFTLGPRSRSQWQVNLRDATKRSYQMTTTWIRSDGFNPKVGPTTRSDTFVVIPSSPPQ
jgi:hypothetical protein